MIGPLIPERQLFGILNAHNPMQLESKVRGLCIGYIGVRSANPLTPEDFYWLLLWTTYTIGPISADQHKQIVSGEEQNPSSWEVVLWSKMEILKNHRN
jgi:hypothetical protein